MKLFTLPKVLLLAAAAMLSLLSSYGAANGDPSKYPQFAQQSVPADVKLSFISIDELIAQVKAGKKPLIIDVRTTAEYREVHILSAVSAPLAEFKDNVKNIPKDRLVVLY
ncbi:MAG: rhodanese-like domain-containing protein [Candidatus Binatia bacterium]